MTGRLVSGRKLEGSEQLEEASAKTKVAVKKLTYCMDKIIIIRQVSTTAESTG